MSLQSLAPSPPVVWRRRFGMPFCMLAACAIAAMGVVVSAATAEESNAGRSAGRSAERMLKLLVELDQVEPNSLRHRELRNEVDRESGQRHGWASRLFWHTDPSAARAEAERDGKLILSLRMLGRLTDELSCANSRFFRTALYPNANVAKTLRENFVLHWSSERPVPVISVDFGDGRVMRRTVTGNSIHYLMKPDGTVVDAMPGMVSPATFNGWLSLAAKAHRSGDVTDRHVIRNWMMSLQTEWNAALASVGRRAAPLPDKLAPPPYGKPLQNSSQAAQPLSNQTGLNGGAVRAERAVVLAAPKRRVEFPLVAHLTLSGTPIQQVKDDALWKALAAKRIEQARLDEASLRLIMTLNPRAANTSEVTFEAMVRNFEADIAEDDVRNRFVFQSQIRAWIMAGERDLAALNQRVYSELFLTPKEDPYIGLLDIEAFTGLVNSGITE